MSTTRGPERLHQPPPRNAKCARLVAFDKIGNVFSLTYSQMIAQQFRQLNEYCRHLYFMKTGHDINCCVFKSRECIPHMEKSIGWSLNYFEEYILLPFQLNIQLWLILQQLCVCYYYNYF